MAPTPQATKELYDRIRDIIASGDSLSKKKDKVTNVLEDMEEIGVSSGGITRNSISAVTTPDDLDAITDTLAGLLEPSPSALVQSTVPPQRTPLRDRGLPTFSFPFRAPPGSSALTRSDARGGRKKKATRRRKTRKVMKSRRKATRRS